jgi:hypothetical protein
MVATMTNPTNTPQAQPEPSQHRAANEAGVPKTAEERREARRAFMKQHRAAYEALANS